MAKLLNILAASVGGGIALGLGIRVGESLVPNHPDGATAVPDGVADRLQALERKAENTPPAPQTDKLPAGISAVVTELVENRLTAMEQKLRREAEERQQATLDAFVENVQARVASRIGALESSVIAQGAAIGELREYSLQTERNIQRLLVGIEKVAARQTPHPEPVEQPEPLPEIEPPAAKRKRWFQ